MKANETPEKIYIIPHTLTDGFCHRWFEEPFKVESIEYTRTDSLIERAAIWFNNNFIVHDEYGVISDSFDTKEEMYEDFKKYMKGER